MTKSRETEVTPSEERTAQALQTADEFLREQGLSGKDALHVRLLAEETLGMVRAMTEDFSGLFWLERSGEVFQVRLSAQTRMDKQKKNDLLSVSTSGKNAAVKGFMGKIGEIFENGMLHYADVMQFQQQYGGDCLSYGLTGGNVQDGMVWSLHDYRTSVKDAMQIQEPAQEAWDELEKSIVASLADDVVVGVKKDSVDLTIQITV